MKAPSSISMTEFEIVTLTSSVQPRNACFGTVDQLLGMVTWPLESGAMAHAACPSRTRHMTMMAARNRSMVESRSTRCDSSGRGDSANEPSDAQGASWTEFCPDHTGFSRQPGSAKKKFPRTRCKTQEARMRPCAFPATDPMGEGAGPVHPSRRGGGCSRLWPVAARHVSLC